MTIRRCNPLLAAFWATGLHAEEETIRVHPAKYEVVANDQSCNEPHQRLLRISLASTSVVQEISASPVCQSRVRRGVELTEWEVPCNNVAVGMPQTETGLVAKDKVLLKATVEMCLGVWDYSVNLASSELVGSIGGVPFDPTPLDESYTVYHQRPALSYDKGTLSIAVECDKDQLFSGAPPLDFEVFFQLIEGDAGECKVEDCVDVLKVPRAHSWAQVKLRATCPEPLAEVSP